MFLIQFPLESKAINIVVLKYQENQTSGVFKDTIQKIWKGRATSCGEILLGIIVLMQ